jgi:hypothetical protein
LIASSGSSIQDRAEVASALTIPRRSTALRTFKTVDDDADSVDGNTAESAKLHLRALEILEEQGQEDDYSADEYVLAVEQAQAAP